MADQHRFIFDFDKALNGQLIEQFELSPNIPLTENIAPSEKGVYALYRKSKIVYAGKALDIKLRRRLNEHMRKIIGRNNLELDEITCRFLVIESDWLVRAAEDTLIRTYNPEWNKSGFGSHIPGAGRPGKRISKWDIEFPPK
jgi:hypothetical protein